MAMTSSQVPTHHPFFRFNLEYGLIFKLRKEVVTDWMEYNRLTKIVTFACQNMSHRDDYLCQMTAKHRRGQSFSNHRNV